MARGMTVVAFLVAGAYVLGGPLGCRILVGLLLLFVGCALIAEAK